MPRRGSRAQLLRDILAFEVDDPSDLDGEYGAVYREALLEKYKHCSVEQLQELTERNEIKPASRGRPANYGRHLANMELVRAVEAVMRFHGLSVTDACDVLAAAHKRRRGKARRALEKLPPLLTVYHAVSGPALRARFYRTKRRMR